jgi:hypothetical protein
MQTQSSFLLVRIGIDVIETIRVEGGCAADDAMDRIPFGEQELGEVRPILTCDAGNEGLRRFLV